MPDRDDFRCAFKNVLYKSQNREAPYPKQQPSIILIKRQQTSENIHSQQCVLLYISDLYISYMLLKLQLRVQYKIKYIYIFIYVQQWFSGTGFRRRMEGVFPWHVLHTVNHDSGTCPSDLAALIEFYYGKQFEHVCYAHWIDEI